jgi:hypothetical protein
MMMLVKRCVEDQGKKRWTTRGAGRDREEYRAEQDMLSAFIAEHLQRNESGRLAVRAVRCVQGFGPVPWPSGSRAPSRSVAW